MAEKLKIETLMEKTLTRDFKPDIAQGYISTYWLVKDRLTKDVLEWIRTQEPQLSDHSSEHIENVLKNAYKLLENEIDNIENQTDASRFDGLNLYFLCMTILFHDVGNFFGRAGHNKEIGQVLKDIFSPIFTGVYSRDKRLIERAGRAHTGKHNSDTLKEIDETETSNGNKVYLRDIAAIVRLADELAEGPQRTSQYMLSKGMFSAESKIFHRYASCTHIMIDSPNGRINITYEIELDWNEDQAPTANDLDQLKEFLTFIYSRIHKLNQERKYCGYYCDLLRGITQTQVSFNFINRDIPLETNFQNLILTDLTVPGDKEKEITSGREDLEIDTVLETITSSFPENLNSATS